MDAADDRWTAVDWRRVLDLFALVAVAPSLLAPAARWWWVADLCCHFRLPYAIAMGMFAVVYGLLRRWRRLAVVSLVLAFNVWLLWPLFAVRSAPSDVDESLRLMAANVFIGNRQPQPVLDLVREERPDLVLLVEVDDRWMSALEELGDEYPHRFQVTRDEQTFGLGPFGIALFSRLPLTDARSHRLGTERTPVVTAKVQHAGCEWTIIGVHPYPPVSSRYTAARDSVLADVARLSRDAEGPKVVLGDLNTTCWSPQFADLLEVGKLRDSEVGFGYQPTWPDWLPVLVLPIDHLLHSPDVRVIDRRIGPSIASDHRPVIVDVTLDATHVTADLIDVD